MGYQFLRVEGYARKAGKGKAGGHSVASILAEANRDQGACPHVQSPAAPIVLQGDLDQVALVSTEWADQAIDARGHKLRQDGLCLLAGVLSAPDTLDDWEGFREASLAFLDQEYGNRLQAVVEHTDESHRHLHFYAVPRPGERFEQIHRGRAAAAEVRDQGAKKGAQNTAYKAAMTAWQEDFHSRVGRQFGLTRIGPRKRRLTRAGWNAEKKMAAWLACEEKKLEATGREMERTQLEISHLKQEVAALKTYREFCERYELDPTKEPSKEDYRRYQEQLDIFLRPRDGQKSSETIEKPSGNSLVGSLKKSRPGALKQPSPAKKKPGFSPGG